MIEMGKRYQTRDGRAVRILCVNGPNHSWPVIGFVGDERQVDWWTANGFHGSAVNNRDDLIPVPTKHEGWIVVTNLNAFRNSSECWSMSHSTLYHTRREAEESISNPVLRVAHVTWES